MYYIRSIKKNIYCISIYLIKDLYNKKHTTYSIVAFSGLLSGNLTANQHFSDPTSTIQSSHGSQCSRSRLETSWNRWNRWKRRHL